MQALPTGEGTPVAPGQLLQPQEPALATEPELKTDEVVDGWIQTNNFAYTKSVDWIKETGDKLAQAKAVLGYRRWGLLFAEGRLRFGQRRAEMIMQIAAHPSLRNPKYISLLPASWSVLLIISRLEVVVVERAVVQGQIHAKMSLKQAKELAGIQPASPPIPQDSASEPKYYVVDWIHNLAAYIGREAASWPMELRAQLAALLRQITEELVPGAASSQKVDPDRRVNAPDSEPVR